MRQDYSTQPMFPIRCFSFKAPKGLTKDTLAKAEKMAYRNYNAEYGVGTTSDIVDNPIFNELHEWFQSCIDTLHVDNAWSCDRIVVNKSWINRSDAESGHHHAPHRHPMSFLSGIFYLTEGPPTVFADPLAQREWAQLHLDGGPISDATQFVNPISGGLFVFPSYMIHSSDPNLGTKNRYSIAFNTFPQGDINMGGWDQSMITLKINDDLGPLDLKQFVK